MLLIQNHPKEYFHVSWSDLELASSGARVGECKDRTFFEILAMVQAVDLWGHDQARTLSVLGDTIGALQEALDMKGRGAMEVLAIGLAILCARRSVHIAAGHLPSERSVFADALSRLTAPGDDAATWPFSEDLHLIQRHPRTLPELEAHSRPRALRGPTHTHGKKS